MRGVLPVSKLCLDWGFWSNIFKSHVLIFSGVLTVSRDDFENPEDIYDALGEMLAEIASEGTSENDIK